LLQKLLCYVGKTDDAGIVLRSIWSCLNAIQSIF